MKPELLAPAGSWAMLNTAINSGADAVYFGVKGFNMRASAKNFELNELKKIARLCHKHNVKAYLTLNIIIYENELKKVENIIIKAKKSKIDAIICWDFSVIMLCKKHNMDFHISTQASISNSAAAEFYYKLGAKRLVLARECSLEQIKEISKKAKAEIEIFIHGAMCVSVSGRCFISQFLHNKSANRGECLQPCRREYIVKDKEEGHELKLENNYVMSAKDLCTIDFIDKILEAGPSSLKIEGRSKQPDYVKTVVEAYKEAITAYYNKSLTDGLKKRLKKRLSNAYNRGFSTGFFFQKPGKEDFASSYGSISKSKKVFIGEIINFYKKINVAEIKVLNKKIKKGDKLIIIGNKTGCIETKAYSIEIEKKPAAEAKKGSIAGVKIGQIARKNDKVYINELLK